jgi:hypothetical protein
MTEEKAKKPRRCTKGRIIKGSCKVYRVVKFKGEYAVFEEGGPWGAQACTPYMSYREAHKKCMHLRVGNAVGRLMGSWQYGGLAETFSEIGRVKGTLWQRVNQSLEIFGAR